MKPLTCAGLHGAGGLRFFWVPVLALLITPSPVLRAQEGGEAAALAARCAAARPDLRAWCVEVVQGARALQAGLGLVAAGPSDIPGSASTLGRRLGTVPRFAFSGRAGAAYVRLPDLIDGRLSGDGAIRDRSFVAPGIQAGLAVGILDGFSLLPTIGGIGSVDLLGAAYLTVVSTAEGFDPGRVGGFGYGVRVGLLRESFTAPGVSVSIMQRRQGDLVYGDLEPGHRSRTSFDLTTTSVRGTIGKNFLLLGILGGIGYDRYSSDVQITAVSAIDPAQRGVASTDGLTSERRLLFAGASLSFLLIQLSAEGGWASGLDALQGRGPSEFDPGGGTPFLHVALRLTL